MTKFPNFREFAVAVLLILRYSSYSYGEGFCPSMGSEKNLAEKHHLSSSIVGQLFIV